MRAIERYLERIRRLPPIAADAALALGLMTYGVIELTLFTNPADDVPPSHFGPSIPLFVGMCLLLVIRRRYAWLALPLILAGFVVALRAHLDTCCDKSAFVLFYVLLFSVAERVPTWASALAVMAGLGVALLTGLPQLPNLSGVEFAVVFFLPAFFLATFTGWAQRRRRVLTVQLQARVDEVRLERERVAERAVAGERIRIAHELRALVLQGVEWMTAQARAARGDLEAGAAGAHEEIEAIESTGRRTLVEMRRLLLVLRRSKDQRPGPEELDLPDDGFEPGTPWGTDGTDRVPRILVPAWCWLRRPWVVDVLLVLVLAGLMAAEEAIFGSGEGAIFAGWLPVVLSAMVIGVLLVRRRVPFSVLCVVATGVFVWILYNGDSPNGSELALLIAVYTVAAYKDPRWAIAAVALAVLSWSPLPGRRLCLCLLDIGALSIFAAVAGAAMHAGRKLIRELRAQTDLLQRTRGERVRLAVAEERTRVAREMHDVVAHGVTVMIVQAGGARMVADTDPAWAAETLKDVERMGVEATGELESLLQAFDPGSEGIEREPAPDTFDVQGLVKHLRRTGQDIELTETGTPFQMDQGLHASVYRIVQEALTNVRKHAGGTRAAVSLRYQPHAVEVEVTNGPPPAGVAVDVSGAGQGLIGIRERVAVFGGTVELGPTPEGGFHVAAELPLELVAT